MRRVLDTFNQASCDLRDFLLSIPEVNKALQRESASVIAKYLAIRKSLDYSAFVVALYAAFERFIEDLLWARVVRWMRKSYSTLPDGLRLKNLRESAALLSKGRLGEGRYTALTDTLAVSNLNSCLSGMKRFALTKEAVVAHEGNLRADAVTQLFGAIEVENVNGVASKRRPLVLWHNAINGTNDDGVPDSVITFRLRNLVDRRNEIAHGGKPPTDILDASELLPILDFFDAYCASICDVVCADYIQREHLMGPTAFDLGGVIEGPFKKKTVVVFAKPVSPVSVGDAVVTSVTGRVAYWGAIVGLQTDGKAVTRVDGRSKATRVGIELPFRVSDGMSFRVVPTLDRDLL